MVRKIDVDHVEDINVKKKNLLNKNGRLDPKVNSEKKEEESRRHNPHKISDILYNILNNMLKRFFTFLRAFCIRNTKNETKDEIKKKNSNSC